MQTYLTLMQYSGSKEIRVVAILHIELQTDCEAYEVGGPAD